MLDHHGEVEYEATPEALEYHETLAMSDDDFSSVAEMQTAAGVAGEEEWE